MMVPMRKYLAAVLAVVLCIALASPVLAADGEVQHGGLLVLAQDETETAGLVLRGLWAGQKPVPCGTLLGLLREATADDAVFTDAKTGEEAPADTPAATGLAAKWTGDDGTQCSASLVVMGDVLGTGTISLSQLTRLAGALYGGAELPAVYALAGCVSGGDALSLTDLVTEAQIYTDTPDISKAEQTEIIDAAAALQTSGGTYSADVFHVVELKAGDIIFGMLPGQSSFYTDMATVEACEGSYIEMYERLQMLPHPEFGYREQLGSYTVLKDTWVACGYCLANDEIGGEYAGPGGGFQYVIPEYENVLELADTIDLHA